MLKRFLQALQRWRENRNRKIAWWEPRWSYAPAMLRSLKRATAPASILRVTILAGLVGCLIVGLFKRAVPQLQFGFLWNATLALPGVYLYLCGMTAIFTAIPPRIEVLPNRVVRAHGQRASYIWAKEMTRARLTVFASNRIRLRIWYTRKIWQKAKVYTRAIGIAPSVNLQALCELLPVATTVCDARDRYASQRRHGTRSVPTT